jgi:4-oxalocrotonate tautomerase
MPLITIESGPLKAEQKRELIEKMTKLASEIIHAPQEFFFVSIKELPNENIGIGGKNVSQLRAEYESKK